MKTKQTVYALLAAATIGLGGCEREKVEQEPLETLIGVPVSVHMECSTTCRKCGPKGYLSTTIDVDGETILAKSSGYCSTITEMATIIETASKKGTEIGITVCRPNGGYYIHTVDPKGYSTKPIKSPPKSYETRRM